MAGMAAKLVSQYFESQDTSANELCDDLLRIGWAFEGGKIENLIEIVNSCLQ